MKKNLVIILFSFLITVGLTGCYTVLWTPNDNFPTESNSDNQNDGFYSETYYGDYAPYYTTPWWYTITPPAYISQSSYVRDTSRSAQFLRNSGGGRGSEPRNVLATPPSARIEPANTGTTGSPSNSDRTANTSGSSNGNRVETANSSNNPSSRAGNTNNKNTVRNNNGSRNTDGRR